MDNLLSAEVVTASGDILRASKDENADLFWGLQGGGGNFGAVSWLEYRLHPVGTVTSGLIAYPFDCARDVLKFCREITSGLPDDLTIFGALLHAPDGAKIAVIIVCHCGTLAAAEAALQPIKKFGTPDHGYNRPDNLRGNEYDAGCRLPSRRAQLLEIQFYD